MNKNKAIVVSGNGVEKRTQVREKDREGLRFSFQVVDDHLTRGRANIDFIETRNFMFFDKNVFRRMVEEPYEMLHWELKKALGFIAYQEGVIANQAFEIEQKDNALGLIEWTSELNRSLLQSDDTQIQLQRAELQIEELDIAIEELEDELGQANDNLSWAVTSRDTIISDLKAENRELRGSVIDQNLKFYKKKDKWKNELKKVNQAYEAEKKSRALEKAEYEKEIARLMAELSLVKEKN